MTGDGTPVASMRSPRPASHGHRRGHHRVNFSSWPSPLRATLAAAVVIAGILAIGHADVSGYAVGPAAVVATITVLRFAFLASAQTFTDGTRSGSAVTRCRPALAPNRLRPLESRPHGASVRWPCEGSLGCWQD